MRALLLSAALVLAASPALADQIDGDWCSAGGRNLRIDGPTIRIPSGVVIEGNYGRHSFRYVGPHGDPDEGVEILMIQRSEEEMTLYRGADADSGAGETWRRCNVTS